MQRPSKRVKLLSDDEDSGSEDSGVPVNGHTHSILKVNPEFAKRFEHNKQREELERLEAKYKDDDGDEDEDDSSSDESEDDDADLITADLDNEIMSTLKAIKNKDPRVYDRNVKFYQEFDMEAEIDGAKIEKATEKPMTLQDYHRENLMAGYTGAEENEDLPKLTPHQEQDNLRRDITRQMHAMADANGDELDASDSDFVVKTKGAHEDVPVIKKRVTDAEIVAADQDPETFLSNFMTSQGWRSATDQNPHAFDSDDSEEEERADVFESAYNMRFEDPETANETLKSFARDNGEYSVRREKAGGRKLAREKEREAKEARKRERDQDRARLRKLRIDEAEKKFNAIKHAAGLRGQDADVEQWRDILDADFDDDIWDREMEKRFDAKYYAQKEHNEDALDGDNSTKRAKKPKWDDDIEINDLVPEFTKDAEEVRFDLTDNEELPMQQRESDEDHGKTNEKKSKTKKDRERDKRDAKAQSRRDRRAIEDMVDASLPVAAAQSSGFRYRETSPKSFGLDAQDILFATDSQLNEFAGLKKLASFRDEGRKAKDRKKLGKKARLREWRKEVFGNADGTIVDVTTMPNEDVGQGESSKKRKRSKKTKKQHASVAVE